jgi:hypothetical protein
MPRQKKTTKKSGGVFSQGRQPEFGEKITNQGSITVSDRDIPKGWQNLNKITFHLFYALYTHNINLATNILERNEVIVIDPYEAAVKHQSNWQKVMINGKMSASEIRNIHNDLARIGTKEKLVTHRGDDSGKGNGLTMLDALFRRLFDMYLENQLVLTSVTNHKEFNETVNIGCIAINQGINLLAKHGFDFKQYNDGRSFETNPLFKLTFSTGPYHPLATPPLRDKRILIALRSKKGDNPTGDVMYDIVLSLAKYGMDVNVPFTNRMHTYGNPLYKATHSLDYPENTREALESMNIRVVSALIKSGALLPSKEWFASIKPEMFGYKDRYNPAVIDGILDLINENEDKILIPYFKDTSEDRTEQAARYQQLKLQLKDLQTQPNIQIEPGVELTTISNHPIGPSRISMYPLSNPPRPGEKIQQAKLGGTKGMRRRRKNKTRKTRKTRKNRKSKNKRSYRKRARSH